MEIFLYILLFLNVFFLTDHLAKYICDTRNKISLIIAVLNATAIISLLSVLI